MSERPDVGGQERSMGGVQRRFDRFLENPSSVRNAVGAITSFTVLAVVLGAVAVRVFDSEEYPTYGDALWFTLQTVTTVGYGDVTPAEPMGRAVAAVVMLASIGLITVLTAAVTSTFVAAAQRGQGARRRAGDDRGDLVASLDALADRLARIEQALGVAPLDPPDDEEEADDTSR
jgi:voltage-gated potassium channel